MHPSSSWKKIFHQVLHETTVSQFHRMQKKEGTSTGLAELAKEKFLDTAHGKILCCVGAVSKKAEFVQCGNQRSICGCDKHVLITYITIWNHASRTLEALLISVQTRYFFFQMYFTS